MLLQVVAVDFAGPSFAALVGQPLVDARVAEELLRHFHQIVDHLRSLADMLHCQWIRCTAAKQIAGKQKMIAVAVVGQRLVARKSAVKRGQTRALPTAEGSEVDLSNRMQVVGSGGGYTLRESYRLKEEIPIIS